MKKNLLILTLALFIALPVLGLATADLTAPLTTVLAEKETAPLGGQNGRRWNLAAPGTRCADANEDGLCDNSGYEPGKNSQAPDYADENEDGICDLFGAAKQGQGQGQGQGRSNAQSQNYADENKDGVCDHFGTGARPNPGSSRNRR